MTYHFAKTLHCSFDEAAQQTTDALKNAGFGILTEINMSERLKKKLGTKFRNLCAVTEVWRSRLRDSALDSADINTARGSPRASTTPGRRNSWKPASGGWQATRPALRRPVKCRTCAVRPTR